MNSEVIAVDARLTALRAALLEAGVDALLLTDSVNIGYMAGFTGSTAMALVSPDEAVLITDPRYTLRAARECPAWTIVKAEGSGSYPQALSETLRARPQWRKVGFEAGHLTYSQWQKMAQDNPAPLEWTPTESLVETLRRVKGAGEVAAIERAIAVAEAAFQSIRPLLKPGTQEREIALALETAMRQGGADDRAFETIVASGPNGAHPHHTAGERRLETGDFVTIDWGAQVNGYNSDITRTVAIGTVDDKQREVYAVVLEAQQRAIAAIAPGKTGKEIDAVARDFLTRHYGSEAFGHGLGHALGRAVHDGLGLSPRAEGLVLAPGMVLTVEPGLYLEDWGGVRIEEDVLVTEGGCDVLTHLPNALDIIAADGSE